MYNNWMILARFGDKKQTRRQKMAKIVFWCGTSLNKMSAAVQDFLQRNDPEHHNWLVVRYALRYLSYGVQKYAENKMKELHLLISTNVGGPGIECNCKCILGKKPNPHGRPTTCIWAQELKKFHVFSRKSDISWHQSISSQWHDPALGYWEIAKLFMSDLGKNLAKTKDPSTTDIGPLLNLLIFCKHFKIQHSLLEAVKNWRNMCAHAPDCKLSDIDKQTAFKDIENLINDPELVNSKDVQDCLSAIKRAQTLDFAILLDNEIKSLQEVRRIEKHEMKEKLKEVEKEIKALKKREEFRRIQDCQEQDMKEKLEEKEKEVKVLKERDNLLKVGAKSGAACLSVLLNFMVSQLWHNAPAMLWPLIAFFFFPQVGDRSVISDEGCPTAMIKSPINYFHFQEFNFSSYLAYKREGFVGRKWFFLELESIFEESRETAGVLITGEPGSGKSALMSQLICSPFSSLLIHDNTIGYHLCEYSEKGKRDGARFVRNLVDQIAAHLPEYSERVMNDEEIRTELDTRCHKDPTGCFFTAIVGPLRRLTQPGGLQFIIIDALDECYESDIKTSEIMEILKSKVPQFPKWLKVILTSRNLTSVTSRLPRMVNRTSLYATDERNVEDIRYYVSRYISQNSMNIRSRTDDMEVFLDEVITRTDGNFLFVKMSLQYINDTDGKVEFHSLPTSLFDLYNIFFYRRFGEDGFEPFRFLFEVLLAVVSPLQSQDVQEILRNEYEAADIPKLIEQVSCFLRFGRDGTVRIYHRSFADWLIDQTPVLLINKTRGHQSIAKFLLHRIRKRHVDVTFSELTELFMHILSGRSFEMQQTAIDLFNITEMRETPTNQSILHYLVTKSSSYLPVLDFFLSKFRTVDILDANNKSPAFHAASKGVVKSLQSCINNGADISSFLEGYTELDPVSVVVQNTGIEKFSLMHVAAAKGFMDVVELLIKSNISYPDCSKNYPTPVDLAARNGHLGVLKLFYGHGATFDPITLHHVASKNHLAVAEFLLSVVGLRDICLPCQPVYVSQLNFRTTIQEAHTYFCETALHAAVSRRHIDMVKLLLGFGKESLECKHHSGKTALMDAVERNDAEMVDLLLEHDANTRTACGIRISKNSNRQMCSIYSKYEQDFLYTVYCVNDSCERGDRAIHVSAKFGLWEMAEKLTRGGLDHITKLRNCDYESALDISVIYDHAHFVKKISDIYNKFGKPLVASELLKSAMMYCSANVATLFLNSVTSHKDETLWQVLLYEVHWTPCYVLKTFVSFRSYCLKAFRDSNLQEVEKIRKESERRLNMIKLLVGTPKQKSLLLNKKNDDGRTLLHIAAILGFEDAVKYLVELGADKTLKDKNGYTPLTLALKASQDNPPNHNAVFRCYSTNDGQFSLCNTTCFDETVRYLIQSQRSNISKCDNESASMLKRVILTRMPLSLYGLLKVGVNLNCRFNALSFAMVLQGLIFKEGREVSEVLKMFEVDLSIKCGVNVSESELHLMSYLSTPGEFGNFFKPSLNKKRFPLQRFIDRHPKGVRILDECYDAAGYLPIHRAAEGGNLAAIKWFKSIGVDTQLKTRGGLTALDISVMGLSDKENTRMHLVRKYESFEELLRTFFDTSQKNYSSEFSSISPSKYGILHVAAGNRLDMLANVYKKALEIIPSLKNNKYLLLDEQDVNGNTPLHIAAVNGLHDVVKYLVRLGADINIKNKEGNTPLLIALNGIFVYPIDHRCYTTNDGMFTSCKTTPYDEIGRHLIFAQKSSISKCDAQSAQLLNMIILKRLPLSLYALLNIGVDLNCQGDDRALSPMQHVRVGGPEVSEVLKMFEVDVFVKCGSPFIYSELHLISYVSVSGDFGNFFKPSLNNKRSPLQRLIDHHPRGVHLLDECYDADGYLPIHRAAQGGNLAAIKWFKSTGVNTQLTTRSGLTALDISVLYLGDSKYGDLIAPLGMYPRVQNLVFEELLRDLTAFDISISYLRDSNYGDQIAPLEMHLNLHKPCYFSQIFVTSSRYSDLVFEELLQGFFGTFPEPKSEFLCGPAVEGLSPLHIAAVKGMTVLRYVHKEASETFPNLPINCVNKHGLDAVYLAKFYDSVLNDGLIDKYSEDNSDNYFDRETQTLKEKDAKRSSQDEMKNGEETDQYNADSEFGHDSAPAAQYPDRKIENIIVFNYLYRPPHLESTEEELPLRFDSGMRISDCPGYYDTLPNFEEAAPLQEENYFLDYSAKCSKIPVRHHYYFPPCKREIKGNHVRTAHTCAQMLKKLKSRFTWRRRRNRQLSQFIANRMGWGDGSQVNNIDNQWPFYFLHKKLLNEYEAYEYLMILNEALEVADIRFYSRD